MREIYEELAELIASGQRVATATIVRTRGSVPREVGAKMLVRPGGGISGTVGGGCGEADAWRAALRVIETGRSERVVADLTEDIKMESTAVCGGIMDILVEPWQDGEEVRRIAAALQRGERLAVVALVESRRLPIESGRRMLVWANGNTEGTLGWAPLDAAVTADAAQAIAAGRSRTFEYKFPAGSAPELQRDGSAEVFVEVHLPSPTLVIAGAGHIAVPLAQIAKLLEFRVVVIDDRASFANRERFPDADEVIAADFEETLRNFPLTPDTYVVLVTRGHQYDVQSLRTVIHAPVAYIGMIGSKRRVWAVCKLLHHEGVPVEKIRRVHAPIGIDIAAETPAEIAVGIAAEIVKIRRGGTAASLSDPIRDRYARLLEEGKELG